MGGARMEMLVVVMGGNVEFRLRRVTPTDWMLGGLKGVTTQWGGALRSIDRVALKSRLRGSRGDKRIR
jgi:hypothetical protein